jgi:hypothetical protein
VPPVSMEPCTVKPELEGPIILSVVCLLRLRGTVALANTNKEGWLLVCKMQGSIASIATQTNRYTSPIYPPEPLGQSTFSTLMPLRVMLTDPRPSAFLTRILSPGSGVVYSVLRARVCMCVCVCVRV